MEIQVILRQVGEHRDVEARARDPAESQRMAGHLHRRGGYPALGHDREQSLQIGRLGGGQGTGQPVPADPGLHPADQSGLVAGRAQPGLQQVGRGGLAAGPGHADEPQPTRRVPVYPAGHIAQFAPRIGEHEDRHPGRRGAGPSVRVGQHRDGPRGYGVGAERGAVDLGPGQRDIQVAGRHRARVERDPAHEPQIVRGKRFSYRRQPDTQQRAESGQRPRLRAGGSDRHGVRVPPITAPSGGCWRE